MSLVIKVQLLVLNMMFSSVLVHSNLGPDDLVQRLMSSFHSMPPGIIFSFY